MSQAIEFSVDRIPNAVTLTDRVCGKLVELVSGGSFPPGAKLPSEASMATQFGVSRTVIREAVSRLKAEGLVESKQGSGVFVREPGLDTPFRIAPNFLESIPAVLQVVELRQALEGEIAALAASRRSAKQMKAIDAALRRIESEERAGHDGVDADVAFHQSIAVASGNPHFLGLIEFLFNLLRNATLTTRSYEASQAALLREVKREHAAIVDAIHRQDADGARLAAREHMAGASRRLREIDSGET
jgi:GntR family transcriptional repressor for pyruvate dehydrogenase complex